MDFRFDIIYEYRWMFLYGVLTTLGLTVVATAGGLERMRAAYDYGADAVYAGSPRYSLRARNNEFAKLDVLEQGIKEAHERNKKFFLTVNTLPHNSKLKTFVSDMEPLIET